jgi:hypothetical protein
MTSQSVQYFLRVGSNTQVGSQSRRLSRYRRVLALFIFGLVVSGLSAFPLAGEVSAFARFLGIRDPSAFANLEGLQYWTAFVAFGLHQTYAHFPFFGYVSDWLGFGNLVIASFFFLPLVDPKRYRGVLNAGLLACAGVVVIALVCGAIREIPWGWRLVDCSFGVFGAIPLLYCLHLTDQMD